jgi:uncharacterized protein YraI
MFGKSVHGAGFAGQMYWNGLPGPQRSGPISEINLVDGLPAGPTTFSTMQLCWRNSSTLSVSVMGLVGATNMNARASDVDTIFEAVKRASEPSGTLTG